MTNVYLDHAATTPLNKEVASVIHNVLLETYGNPSSVHSKGRKAKGIVEEARVTIAKYLKCEPSEIYFTSCGTESNNIALRKAVHCLGVKNIITSPIEHHAVLSTAQQIAETHEDVTLHLLKVDNAGNYDINELELLLAKNKNCLVTLMHANNELGNLADLDLIGNLCKEHKAYFHTDAVQTIGYFDYNLGESNIDMLSASAHKFNGPKGVGFLYLKKGIPLKALIVGGNQERGLRAGTENVASIAGMSKAISLCYDHLNDKKQHIGDLRKYFINEIKTKIPSILFNGNVDNSHYTVVNIALPIVSEMLLFNLDLMGICVSGGSACSSGASKGSHVTQAIGGKEGYTNLRFSFGASNTQNEVDFCIQSLLKILNK